MSWRDVYEKWWAFCEQDAELEADFAAVDAHAESLEDCFYTSLTFGTGGMRGEIGPGPNRMNRYTVRKGAYGLAQYLSQQGKEKMERGVVIAFDPRHRSQQFANEAAATLGQWGIPVYLFNELRPTPVLSYAVRHVGAAAGIMITASHNPPEYNGFKVYGEDGAQLPPGPATALINCVEAVEDELKIPVASLEQLKANHLLVTLGEDVDEAYNEQLKSILPRPSLGIEKGDQLKVVFSPLHGTANLPVRRALETNGFTKVYVVEEQEQPDPDFTTVARPNPEEPAAFERAIKKGKEVGADLLVATDPDADRVGLAVYNEDKSTYQLLNGNETGALLLNYLLIEKADQGNLPKNGAILKTIVTSELGRKIADSFDIKTIDTLTGFKFIAEKMKEFEEGETHSFLFGYEESYGYLAGSFVRDKDAVQAILLACEMALSYKMNKQSLLDGLQTLYQHYQCYKEGLVSVTLKGKQGVEQITEIMDKLRKQPPTDIKNHKVVMLEDYSISKRIKLADQSEEEINLPPSNVLKFWLEGENWFCVRPSGTEPKIKFYVGVVGDSEATALQKLSSLKEDVVKVLEERTGVLLTP
ncbi:phospho-sugar mutase [Salsuginibacillus kocurii]|uniref:phospho-sugar mutase n=1 Tax=Salsuginibacillus kocurii TaxID=427078 RepID=UPI000381014D|nr:phospho-sugar mutase [Salsuginibacillus kocurii]